MSRNALSKRNRFTLVERVKACQEASKIGNQPVADRLGVHVGTVRRWRRTYASVDIKSHVAPEATISHSHANPVAAPNMTVDDTFTFKTPQDDLCPEHYTIYMNKNNVRESDYFSDANITLRNLMEMSDETRDGASHEKPPHENSEKQLETILWCLNNNILEATKPDINAANYVLQSGTNFRDDPLYMPNQLTHNSLLASTMFWYLWKKHEYVVLDKIDNELVLLEPVNLLKINKPTDIKSIFDTIYQTDYLKPPNYSQNHNRMDRLGSDKYINILKELTPQLYNNLIVWQSNLATIWYELSCVSGYSQSTLPVYLKYYNDDPCPKEHFQLTHQQINNMGGMPPISDLHQYLKMRPTLFNNDYTKDNISTAYHYWNDSLNQNLHDNYYRSYK